MSEGNKTSLKTWLYGGGLAAIVAIIPATLPEVRALFGPNDNPAVSSLQEEVKRQGDADKKRDKLLSELRFQQSELRITQARLQGQLDVLESRGGNQQQIERLQTEMDKLRDRIREVEQNIMRAQQ